MSSVFSDFGIRPPSPSARVDLGELTEQLGDYVDEDLDAVLSSVAYELLAIGEGDLSNRFDDTEYSNGIPGTSYCYINYIHTNTGLLVCTLKHQHLTFRLHEKRMDRRIAEHKRSPSEILEIFGLYLETDSDYFDN